jgi:hypothetical protein
MLALIGESFNRMEMVLRCNASTPPVVAPTATTLSGLTDTLPANSVTIYNWTTGAPPPPTVTGVAFTIGRPF